MAEPSESLRQEYTARMNRVIDYITAHLDRELKLEELAEVACFSRFHFHRVFSALIGETLGGFIRRLRLERAASMLLDHPRDSVTDIALACGFSSPSVFARSFRERFRLSASQWRRKGSKVLRKTGEAPGSTPSYSGDDTPHRRRDMEKIGCEVEVKELPELNVAYVRHIGAFQGMQQAFGRLMRWAGPRGLLRFPETKSLGVYHDSPSVTETERLRSDACITVPEGTAVTGEIGLSKIPGGKFAVARFEIAPEQFGAAWDAVMGGWMPGSGWQPDDRACYELYLNDARQHPEGKFIVEICVPVRPL